MSEEERRWHRTQGKFGAGNQNGSNRKKGNFESFTYKEGEHDGGKEHSVRKSKKQSSQKKRPSDPEAHTEKTSSPRKSYGSNEATIKIEYQENAEGAAFSGLEGPPHIEEVRTAGWHTISETDNGESKLYFEPDFMKKNVADRYFSILDEKVRWFDKKVIINGVERPQPRLVAWYGPLPYTYSGVTLEPKEFPGTILEIKKSVEKVLEMTGVDVNLNSVLLNLYRNGYDSVAWHSDDETSMGIQPTIASVSLGETRRFEMRRKPSVIRSDDPPAFVVYLQHGSLVVMDGVMQTDWQHRVPKEYHTKDPRINLTFRTVFKVEKVPRKPTFNDFAEYKKPPFPKKTAEPFQLKGEAFPALGATPDSKIPSKSQPRLKNIKIDDEDSSSTENIAKEIEFRDDGKIETEPSNPKHSSPVSHPSDEMQDDRTLKNKDESEVCDSHTECSVANTDIFMDTDSCAAGTWEGKPLTDVPVFVPGNPKNFDGKSRHQNSPENNNRNDNYHASSECSHWHERSGSCSSSQGRPKKSHQKSEQYDASKYEPNDDEVITRVRNIYDYIGTKQNIFNESYQQDDINLLMTIVEHSEKLPIHVLGRIADRLEILTEKAEYHYYNRQGHYRSQNRGNSRKYSSRYNK